MRKFSSFLINFIFFAVIALIAVTISTIALTKKVNDYTLQSDKMIKGTVIKQILPVLASGRGVIKKIYVRTGQEVKKGDLLVELDNKALEDKIGILNQYKDNESAQTEAKIAQQELGDLKITAPADSTVGDIEIAEGSPSESLSKIMTLYSNENIKLLAQLDVDKYQTIKSLPETRAYSERLNQSFFIVPEILDPNVVTPEVSTDDKKIGLYFKFKNRSDAVGLLNNEDLTLHINSESEKVNKPIDYFVNFWNQFFSQLVKAK